MILKKITCLYLTEAKTNKMHIMIKIALVFLLGIGGLLPKKFSNYKNTKKEIQVDFKIISMFSKKIEHKIKATNLIFHYVYKLLSLLLITVISLVDIKENPNLFPFFLLKHPIFKIILYQT